MTTLHAALTGQGLVLWARPAGRSALRSLARAHFGELDPDAWAPATALLSDDAVRGLGLEGRVAVELLRACAGRGLLAPGIAIGEDLAYWCEGLRLAAETVAAARFLPGLVRDGVTGRYRATWEPVLGERERKLAAALGASMPDSCRAISAGKSRPPADAATTLERFLTIAVDALVRSAQAKPPRPNGANALHDRWVHALLDGEPAVEGTAAELGALAAQIESWRRAVIEEHAAEHRLCLRVVAPEADGGTWRVHYLLQSRSDPSLLIDAKTAWNENRLRRSLLTSLGRAAQLSKWIEASLRRPAPWGFHTDLEGAYAFLSETAWLLAQSGVGLLLPSWWVSGNAKPRLASRARVSSPVPAAGLRADTLLQVNWSVALGKDALTATELERLASLKVPLVRLRGEWVHVDRDELRAALERVRNGAQRVPLGEIVRMRLDPHTSVEARGRVASLFDALQGKRSLQDLPPPESLRATLRPYQVRGYSWLAFLTRAGLGACLADDMGLGKTIQTLSLILRDREEGAKDPVLLVCPTSVIGNWVREAQRFTPELALAVHHGAERVRGSGFKREVKRHAMVLTSYALLHRDAELLRTIRWRGIVLDEAQNVKNPDSGQARAARSLEGGYRVVLTGTPVENHVGDLWSLMEFLNPGMLGPRASFTREYLIPIQAMHDRDAADRLRERSGPFILRRLKSDPAIVPDLPEKNEMKVFCTLTREQASLYAAVLRDYESSLSDSDGMQRRGVILAMLSKLKQVCNHPAQFTRDRSPLAGRSGKLARLEEMIEEVLGVGERALIFTQFAEMGKILTARLCERFAREVSFLHGEVPKKRRDAMVEEFAAESGPALFVLSLKAGGSGLNLMRANHVFHYDRWWNPAVENQATDRAFRIGQTKNVQVHKFICAGTLEERIDALIEGKRAIADNIVGNGDAWLTELSNDALQKLVALSAEL